jgi:CBS domain-containing protein
MAKSDYDIIEGDNVLSNDEVLYRIAAFQYHERLDNLMEKNVFVCRPTDHVQAVAETMSRRRISSAVVTDEKLFPLGIVTERDMVRKVIAECRNGATEKAISDIMTPHPVYLSPDDSLFDALSVLSRHKIKHLPIVEMNRIAGIITLRQIMKIRHAEPFVIIGELEKAGSGAEFRRVKEDLIELVREKLETNSDPVDIVSMLSLVNATIHKRLLNKTISELGSKPPVDFCFFVTGSHGRRENLLFPDQDFCVIIDDFDDGDYNEFDRYFLEVSQKFAASLDEAGFPFCSGNVMGQNPTWRKRVSEWLLHVSYMFRHQGPYTVRYMTLIFDSAHLFGEKSLFDRYIQHAFAELSENHNILRQMHEEEEGTHRVPLGLFNTFITEKSKPHRGEIDMKKSGLIFIIESTRLLAMRHGISETSTIRRIGALVDRGVIHKDDSEYFENAYKVILYHTLKAQVDNYLKKSTHSYYLKPRELSRRKQDALKQGFKAISRLQEIVRSDFGELVL